MEKGNAESPTANSYRVDRETEIEAQYKNGKWIADLSSIIGKDKISQVTPGRYFSGDYDSATGLMVLYDTFPSYITFYVGNSDEEDFTYYEVNVIYKSTGKTINTFAIEYMTDPKFTVDTSGIDIDAIYNTFGVGTDVAATMIGIGEYSALAGDDFVHAAYLEKCVREAGEQLQKVYPRVEMSLYISGNDGRSDWIKNNFGSIALSFDAGIENAGKSAVVYQLYNEEVTLEEGGELIPYRNLTVDSNGMVTVTTTKLGKSVFAIAFQNELPVSNTVKVNTNVSEVKVDTSGINANAIYKAFGIDTENTDSEIIVEQKEADAKNKEYLTNYVKKYGDKVLNVYDVVMNLYGDGEYKGTVTDNFGNLTLSLYTGTEHKGKKAVVYQLHGEDEVITYKDLIIDSNGMVTITVSKLSTFAVALQDSTVTADTSNAESNTVNKAASTGDSANIALWFVLAIFAMFIMASVERKKQGINRK